MIINDIPPQDLEAEKGLLGSVMLVCDCLDSVRGVVSPEDFYLECHQQIFRAMLSLIDSARPVDAVTLSSELERLKVGGRSVLEEVGGDEYLIALLNSVPHAAHAVFYAEQVAECASRRGVRALGAELLVRVSDGVDRSEELIEFAAVSLDRMNEKHSASLVDAGKTALEFLHDYEAERTGGLLTGFNRLDELMGGLFPGTSTILAARPGVGKSALAARMARNVAAGGSLVYFVSLEMSRLEILGRMVAQESRINATRLKRRTLGDEERELMVSEVNFLSSLPIWFDDSPSISLPEIVSKARTLHRRSDSGIGLIVIDYLQLIRATDPKAIREQQVAAISKGLKELSRSLSVPVVALSQLKREVEGRKPRLSDLRESGSLEQDADNVIFLHRSDSEDEPQDSAKNFLIIEKQRGGETGEIPLDWEPEFMLFKDPESLSDYGENPFRNAPEGVFLNF